MCQENIKSAPSWQKIGNEIRYIPEHSGQDFKTTRGWADFKIYTNING